MRRNSINSTFAAVVMVVWLTPTAKGCSCMDSGPPCQAYWPASAVFTGQVIEITTFTSDQENFRGHPQKLIRFAVNQTFRGVPAMTVEAITGNGGGDCGYPFKVGQSYLVYAYGDQKSNKLHAGICSRTRLLSEASEDLAYLQNLTRGKEGGTILGAVGSFRNVKSGYQPPRPLPNVRVTVEGSRGSFDVLTDDKGEYSLAGLVPGAYKVRITPPEGLWVADGERKVEIQDRGCAFVSFSLHPNTSLSGKVLDENGEPVSEIMVDLIPVDQISERYQKDNQFALTDDKGHFEFNAIPPGEYFLGVRLNRLGSTFHYPRTFYPNTEDLSQAKAITIRQGITLERYDLQLPEKLRSRMIQGVVLWPDGRGVSGDVRMCVEEIEHADGSTCNGAGLKVEEDGRFSFSGLDGLRYLLRAHVQVEGTATGSGQRHAEPVEVPPKGNITGLKLVITEPNGSCAKCDYWKRKNN